MLGRFSRPIRLVVEETIATYVPVALIFLAMSHVLLSASPSIAVGERLSSSVTSGERPHT